MKIGIIQGRLLEPVDGHIQEFPKENYKRELALLNHLSLNHIEWLVTEKNPLSPMFITRPDLVSSVCLDLFVNKSFPSKDVNSNLLYYYIKSAGVNSITIPLLEDSNMEDDERRKIFIQYLQDIPFDGVISIEAELSIPKLKEIVDSHPNVYVTYDTGNCTSYGMDHEEFVSTFRNKISNVHLKDRTMDSKTVLAGTGDTPFKDIFEILKNYDYNGLFTIQTARGETGKEFETIRRDKKFFEEIYKETYGNI
jgi:hypothetical protein